MKSIQAKNPSQAEADDQENQSVLRQNEKRAPRTVLTEVELVGLVCVSWMAQGVCQTYVTSNVHFIPMVG